MSFNRTHAVVVGAWFVAWAALIALRVAVGMPTSAIEGVTFFFLGCVPAVILVSVFRGAPPQTIAQVLYDAERRPGAASVDAGRGSHVARD